MNLIKKKLQSITFRYGILSIMTGLIILLYTKIVFLNLSDTDIGIRFNANNFYESDLFKLIAASQIIIGIIYLLIDIKASFYLIDKKTILHFWFTNSFVLTILSVPLLDKYYPTDTYRDSIFSQIITSYMFVSCILFFIGLFHYFSNIIKGVYSSFIIKKGWK